MNPRSASPALSCRADSVFDQLVDELIAQLQAGAAPDWSALAREHPDHVTRLRNMAQTLEALDDLSSADDLALSGVAPLTVAEGHIAGLLGDFRIVREVGRGGMGVVYEAEQVSLNRRVALKVLPLAATLDPRQLQRFRHEARAAGLLHHSHIVPVYGVGCERGIHYYAMQLIEGCSLASVIALWRGSGEEPKESTCSRAKSDAAASGAETPSPAARATIPSRLEGKPFRQIAELVAQAADALEYAHAMGVVHRDVKPANLLLDAGGNVWVTDFGLARLGEGPGLTVSGDLLGTLRYMSPEQALAKHGLVDHRTDIYSLGATLYELLTRRPAVDGASKEEILHRLAFAEPVAPRKLDRSIPAELETVTLKAIAKDPGERYATAQELADDLQRWLTDRPIMARPPGLFQRLRKWSHRHRPLVVVMGVSVVLVTVALCLGAVEYGIKKGELADERSRLADDKDRSERVLAEQLHQVLVDRAETARLARSPGYRRQIWTGLRQAIALRTGEEKADQIRATVLASLGDPVGLDPVPDPNVVRRQTHPDLPPRVNACVREAANRNLAVVSPGGDVVAAVESNSRVAVYGYDTDPFRREESPLGAVYELALAADGKTLAAGCEQGFFAWNLAGQDRWLVRGGNVISVAISPNGRLLGIAGRQLELWSLASKRLIASWPAPEAGAHVEFSADGRILLAIAKGAPVAGWPVSDTPERRVFDGHTQGVPAVDFSPDGRQLVSVSKDRTVRVWDAATGRPLRTLTGHPGEIEAVTFNPDGSLLATGDLAGTVRVWDFAFGRLLAEVGRGEPPGQIWRLQFGPGGEYLAAAGRHLVVWTVRAAADQVRLERLCTLAAMPDSPGVIDVVARPGGSELIYLNRGGRLYAYDLAQADDSRLLADARAAVRSLHFTPTGDRLTFVNAGGTLGLWEWETKAATDSHRRAESVAVSADGRWAAVGGPGQSVTVAELISGRSVLTLPPEGSDVWCLAWSPDGTRLAVGLSDGAVAVWDLEQVRARLAEFGFESPSTAASRGPAVAAPMPEFDRIIQLNRIRAEAEKGRRLAKSARDEGDHAAERDHLVTALNLDERLAETVPNAPGHRKRLASTHGALGRALARLGNIDSALRHLDLEARLLQQLLVEHRGNVEYRRLLAAQRTGRSKVLDQAKRMAEAVDDARRAVADRTELAADPGTPLDREQLAVAYGNLGLELTNNAQWAEAEDWYRAALAAFDRLAADSPTQADTPSFRTGRGTTLNNLGILLTRGIGDQRAAEKPLREAVAIRTQLADDFPANPDYASDLGRTLEWLAGLLRAQRRFDESLRLFREAVRRQAVAVQLRPKNRTFLELRCKHQAQIADTFLQMGRAADAAAEARELQRLAPGDPAVLVRASCLFVTCTRLTQDTSDLPWAIGLALSRAYQIEAVALLRQATAKGLANPIQVLGDPVLDPIRNCEEFRLLLHEVTAHRH